MNSIGHVGKPVASFRGLFYNGYSSLVVISSQQYASKTIGSVRISSTLLRPFSFAVQQKGKSSLRILISTNFYFQRRSFQLSMTNKPRIILQQSTNSSNKYAKSHYAHTNGIQNATAISQTYTLPNSPHFQNMASIQKLAIEPTREHIENIRAVLRQCKAKDNEDQQITLEKDNESGIGIMCIKSAAKNGISAKMMCDLLDTIDELYSWPEGKGVIIYGHNGFFCSGKWLEILNLYLKLC